MIVARRLVVFPEADRDADSIAEYIAATSLPTALRFLSAVEHTYERILEWPESAAHYGFTRAALSDLRAWPVRGFPKHLIFYRTRSGAVQVVRLLHAARDVDAAFLDGGEPD